MLVADDKAVALWLFPDQRPGASNSAAQSQASISMSERQEARRRLRAHLFDPSGRAIARNSAGMPPIAMNGLRKIRSCGCTSGNTALAGRFASPALHRLL